jgi:ABC-type dipeptide/oligopeptide/nickel transport system ATPase component
LLAIDNCTFRQNQPQYVDTIAGISLAVQRNGSGIVGETGCSKTVTRLSVLGLLPKSAQVTQGRFVRETTCSNCVRTR